MVTLTAGYKFTPSEEFLVGDLLRKRLRGERLEGAAATWVREADVYGDEPERLTSQFVPANHDPCEWFFFNWCKLIKAKKAQGRQGKNRRKERTVRRDGRVEIGHWRSTQAVKNVIHIDDSGRAVVIGYHQNFEYRDSKKQKSEWLMEEYGVLPPLEDAGGDDTELVICKIYKTPAARRADQAKRSAGSSPASPIPSPVLMPSQHTSPQQQPAWTESLQPPPFGPSPLAVVPPNQPNPWLSSAPLPASGPEQVLQHPFSSEPSLFPSQHDPLPPPPLPWHSPGQVLQHPFSSEPSLFPSQHDPLPPPPLPWHSPGQVLQHPFSSEPSLFPSQHDPLPWHSPGQVLQHPFSPEPSLFPSQHDPLPPPPLQWHWPGQLPPPPLPQPDMPQYNIAMTGGALSDAACWSDDLLWSDGNQFASDEHRGIIDASAETLQPPPPPAVVVNPQPHAVSAAHVGDDRTPAVSQSSQCTATTAMISEHHADNGGFLPPPDEQQQQQQQQQPPPRHAELDATARTRRSDLQRLERSTKRRNILGTQSSLFVSSSPCRPTVRRAPTSAR